MIVKFSRNGQFLGCSKYPECKSTRPMDGSARPTAVETEHKCTKCGIKASGRGKTIMTAVGSQSCDQVVAARS